jgi:hypothetical protein
MFVYRLEREAAAGHLDQRHGPGWARCVTLQPFVDGLVGDAQVGIAGKDGHDAWDTVVAHPLAELGLPAAGDSFVAPLGKGVVSEHRFPFESGAYPCLGPGHTSSEG